MNVLKKIKQHKTAEVVLERRRIKESIIDLLNKDSVEESDLNYSEWKLEKLIVDLSRILDSNSNFDVSIVKNSYINFESLKYIPKVDNIYISADDLNNERFSEFNNTGLLRINSENLHSAWIATQNRNL